MASSNSGPSAGNTLPVPEKPETSIDPALYQEILPQQSDTVPGITVQSGDNAPLYSNSSPQPSLPAGKVSLAPSRLKVTTLRPLWKRRTTVTSGEDNDGSQIRESTRDSPQVRFIKSFVQPKSSFESNTRPTDGKSLVRPTDVFNVPSQEQRFIRLLSSRIEPEATETALKSINIVFVNMVVASPGEQDKTWTFEKTVSDTKLPPEKPISDGATVLTKKDPAEGGVRDQKGSDPSSSKQRRASTATTSENPVVESRRSHSSQESRPRGDPSPYLNGAMSQVTRSKSSLESKGEQGGRNDANETQAAALRRGQSLRKDDPKNSGLKTLTTKAVKRSPEVKQVNWLIDPDFLSKSIPEARVIQCGYRYDPTKQLTSQFYDDVCDDFLEDLTQFILINDENSGPLDGPILFVASGDAGFVVEKAIITCVDSRHPIVELIAGVIFLATPFVGSQTFCKNIGKVIGRPVLAEEKLFFGRKSTQVLDLSSNFRKRIETIGIPIWCFQSSSWKVHSQDVFEIATSKLSNEYHEIGRFESTDDPDYLMVMEKLLDFTNGRQLMDAAKEGELERIQAILEKKDSARIEVDYQDVLGRTALIVSVRNNTEEVTEWLVKFEGANVRLADCDGYTALHCAVQNQSVRNVRLLLEAGADVKARIFTSSAQKSALEMARHLAKEKERLDPKAKYKDDPIYWQLTHRPFLLDPSSYITQRKLKRPKAPTAPEIIDACNQHIISAVEFFNGKGPVRDSRTVLEMVYSSDANSGPMETLDKALGLALQNEREEQEGSGRGKGKVKVHRNVPESLSRWYHIPANNMIWVQDFLLKLDLDVPPLSWMTEKHDGPTPHSRFMRPFAKTIVAHHDGKEKKILACCMPFLDYESTSGRVKMVKHIRNKLFSDRFGRLIQTLVENWETRMKSSKYPALPDSDSESGYSAYENRGNDIAPSTTDAPTITTSADPDEDFNAEFRKAKKSIIDAYLTNKLPVHVRRTLDQYYYYMLPDTEHRDRDQVVYRHRKRTFYPQTNNDSGHDPDDSTSAEIRRKKLKQVKLLMVDQLWLWYIPRDESFKSDIVLTCFPKRWCQNNPGDSDLLETMLKFEGRGSPVSDIHSLIGLITSKCANIFDRSVAPSDIQFMEYFESAIGKAADEETTLFDEFDRLSKQLNLDEKLLSSEKSAEVLDQFLKIDDETKLLIDVKDIQDEISTILLILNDQMDVLEKISVELKTVFSPSLPSISATATSTFDDARFWEKHQMIANNIRDFQEMEGQAKKTYDALNHLLELKTRQANAWEARFARKGGEEVARQGKTIFWFTVVTIIFLPLSFMASFMALNIKQFPKDNTPGGGGGNLWELGFASSILFGISFAMSIPLIILAFNVSTVQRFLAAHLFSAFLKLVVSIFHFLILKWKLHIDIRAWLPKLLSRLQYDGYLPDPLPNRLEEWKDRKQEEFDIWKLGLDKGNEDPEARRRRLEKDMEMDEKWIFEEEVESSDSDDESDDEDGHDDATTVTAKSHNGVNDEVNNQEGKDTQDSGNVEGDTAWDIFGLRTRGERLRKGVWGQGKSGNEEKGDEVV